MSLPAPLKRLIVACLGAVPAIERRVLPSSGYRKIDRQEAARLQATATGWKNERSAAWQLAAYDRLIENLCAGNPRLDFVIAAQAVDAARIEAPRLLEVGCGGGYHSAVLKALCECRPVYAGADYSAEMVDGARARFPGVPFEVADTTSLPHENDAFDIVMDGVSLMHILDYRRAIGEIARVAASHAVLHCVPVFDDGHATQYLFKYAYGQPVTEAVYNRQEFEAAIAEAGLIIERSWNSLDYDVHAITSAHSHSRTYLCRKAAKS